MATPIRTLVVCSGGLDSTTLAYKVANDPERELIGLLSFDYGQRHKKELDFAAKAAQRFGVFHEIIDIAHIGALLSGCALTDSDNVEVPDGHYAEQTMKITIVPNRNAIMLTIAYGLAASRHAQAVATAVHGGDHFIYPDCRPPFVESFDRMQKYALADVADIELYTPFLHKDKADIAQEAAALGLPFDETWSCYKGGEIHCGRCGTCVERQEAFHLAGLEDPTVYEDTQYWIGACERAAASGHKNKR